jgi:hypothetical protein
MFLLGNIKNQLQFESLVQTVHDSTRFIDSIDWTNEL